MGDARADVLARVRAALGPSPEVPAVPRDYAGAGAGGFADPVAVFCERAAEYRAEVHRVPEDGVEAAIAERLAAHGARRVAVPPALPWALAGAEAVPDDPALTPAELDALDGVVTGCAVAIAATGTIVLDGAGACGRRALSLVPDLHVCVVRADQVVQGVPDAIAALDAAVRAGRPLTWISGPSATSDIELRRVEGVHGPRRLEVLVSS